MPNTRKMEWALASICRALQSEESVTNETLEMMERFVQAHSHSKMLDLSTYSDVILIRNSCLYNLPTTKPQTIEKSEIMLARFSEFLDYFKDARMHHESAALKVFTLSKQPQLVSTKEYVIIQHISTLTSLGFVEADIECMSEYKIAVVGIYGQVLFGVLGLKQAEYVTFIHECNERKILALYRHHHEIIRVVNLDTAMTFSDSKISGICEIIEFTRTSLQHNSITLVKLKEHLASALDHLVDHVYLKVDRIRVINEYIRNTIGFFFEQMSTTEVLLEKTLEEIAEFHETLSLDTVS